jgi:hypothetical protein
VRLFACACCRRIWAHLPEDRRSLVLLAERYADGLARAQELQAAVHSALKAFRTDGDPAVRAASLFPEEVARTAADAAASAVFPMLFADPSRTGPPIGDVERVERAAQADLLRDVLGNPFAAPALEPCWRTPDVLRLARAGYEERALPEGVLGAPALGVLADALEEAGCADHHLLSHLRGPGPHVRGCFVLDLLLELR